MMDNGMIWVVVFGGLFLLGVVAILIERLWHYVVEIGRDPDE